MIEKQAQTCATCVFFTETKASGLFSAVHEALGMGACSCPEPAENPRPATNLMHPEDSCEHYCEKV
jgi:hypothetical protein